MILATLRYVKQNWKTLMVHRNKLPYSRFNNFLLLQCNDVDVSRKHLSIREDYSQPYVPSFNLWIEGYTIVLHFIPAIFKFR